MTLQPCPNEECRSEAVELQCGSQLATDPAKDSRVVVCLSCDMRGPEDHESADEATRLWNALPRTEPWVSVSERMPEDGARVDLVFAKNPDCEVDEDYTVTTDPELMHERGFVPLDSVAPCYTHWRPHTPPRGPVSR